ncbi:class I SAM-dependent methyltransferase [Saccharopolyspora sp. HNM0983]|uniref:Class I SAM-dependent methyltransferase n=1 Tax=Saccharopolyspora montiporae TaxID=2781240 RepID=A0A929BBS4_9PSEU|nr:class I SAM-dependent methyltransferase [Saccharopolyspora sp. HNM0983]MBE9375116.1 class I SAM-dependent methyltransferase [Saccharopolyspora sp. HNM0983]
MDQAASTGSTRNDPHAQERAARQAPLLLHSLSLFEEIFALLFRERRIRRVVEVGVESGQVSAMYARLGAEVVHCVEPLPTEEMRANIAGHDALDLVERPSPEAFDELPVADLYVLDGDHNYAVVSRELDWITRNAPDALVVLHDVLWPWGRRDLYYQPTPLDVADRQPDGPDGPTVWHDGVTPAGFIGAGAFTNAVEAGGERNGVCTAVEDVLAEAPGAWWLRIVPAVFGLGVLGRAESPAAEAICAALDPIASSGLLAALENNRIALYTRVLQMQYDAAAHAGHADELSELVAGQQQEIQELRGELEPLRAAARELREMRLARHELEQERDRLRTELSPLPSLRRWADRALVKTRGGGSRDRDQR